MRCKSSDDRRCQAPAISSPAAAFVRPLCSTMVTKKALLVFPTYAAHKDSSETDKAVHKYLMKMGLIPNNIMKQSKPRQIGLLTTTLIGNGFTVEPLDTYITADELQDRIKANVRARPDVFLIVFCGHGASGMAGPNTFFLSGNTCITALKLQELFAKYKGTLIQFFNMCEAGPHDPWAYNAAPAATPPTQLYKDSTYHEECSHFTVYSSGAKQTQKVGYADAATNTFLSLVGKEYEALRQQGEVLVEGVPVELVESDSGSEPEEPINTINKAAAAAAKQRSAGPMHLIISAGPGYKGTFPNAASAMVSV